VQQAWKNDLSKPLAERSPLTPRPCDPRAELSPPQQQQQQEQKPHAFPRLTRSLSPLALANLQTMLSRQPAQKAMPSPYPALGGPAWRSAQYDSPPESPKSPIGDEADAEDGMALERQVDFSRACFDSQCAQQSGLLAAASRDRAMPAPLFLRGGELASGTMDGRVRLLPIAAPYPLSDSSSWHEPRTSTTRQNGAASPGPIHVGEGLMEVTLQPGMSSIVDLKSRCTDGLLLLSTTASFVPRAARTNAAC